MSDQLELLITELKNKGYRDSRLKRKILFYLLNAEIPLSVPDIIQKLDQENEKYFRSSLYREIEKLDQEHIILEIDLLDGKKRYEINNKIHHHHAKCTNCSNVICVEIPNNLEDVEKKILKNSGFKVSGHVLEFFGICKNCQNN